LAGQRPLPIMEGAFCMCRCTESCTRPLRRAAAAAAGR
jgi:hypothetical protein